MNAQPTTDPPADADQSLSAASRRAAGGDQVVDEQHALAVLHRHRGASRAVRRRTRAVVLTEILGGQLRRPS